MPNKRKTNHRCPKEGERERCVWNKKTAFHYCETHCWQCEKNPRLAPLLRQECGACGAEADAKARKENKQRADEISANNPKLNREKKK
jgi:hypothetical protein